MFYSHNSWMLSPHFNERVDIRLVAGRARCNVIVLSFRGRRHPISPRVFFVRRFSCSAGGRVAPTASTVLRESTLGLRDLRGIARGKVETVRLHITHVPH